MWQNQMNAQFRGTTWQRMHMAANKHLAANQLVLARASWFSIFISWFLTSAEHPVGCVLWPKIEPEDSKEKVKMWAVKSQQLAEACYILRRTTATNDTLYPFILHSPITNQYSKTTHYKQVFFFFLPWTNILMYFLISKTMTINVIFLYLY